MANLLKSAQLLVSDLASTLLFLAVYLLSDNLFLAVGLGMALGVAQIGWQLLHRKPIGTLQWLSVVLVLASGTATFFTRDPHFVMVKPSVIYVIVGLVMLKRGWMNRYLPPRAEPVKDVATVFGYVWAGLMFFTGPRERTDQAQLPAQERTMTPPADQTRLPAIPPRPAAPPANPQP